MLDVLIIGAGPAGLALACDLQRRGMAFRLVERLPEPVLASKGKGLVPRTLEVFDDLGLVDAVLAAGGLYPPIRVYQAGRVVDERRMMELRDASEDVPYPNAIMLPQWKTETLLQVRLTDLGGRVDRGCELETLTQDDDGVTAILASQAGREVVRARYLVGADGGRSRVRHALAIPMLGDTPSLAGFIVADVHVEGLDREYWHLWGKPPAEFIGLCPLASTDAFQLVALVEADENPSLDLATLQRILDSRAGDAAPRLSDLGWISLYRPNVRMAERFRDGRVFLVGDAAHVHPPSGGQGLNTSVQDAYNLGWKLERALDGDATILDTYEEERQPIAAIVLGQSDRLYRREIAGDGAAMRRGDDDEKQLLLNYRGASLARPSGLNLPLQPGDRMPNAHLADASGRRVELFDLLRGPHASLLDIGVPAKAPTIGGQRIKHFVIGEYDVYRNAGNVLGALSGFRITVRPDGYIREIGPATAPPS
jgi:2-polyprenyl-6-methoxyphenol hydroxylase-like FAD-dependent oxidoreductase